MTEDRAPAVTAQQLLTMMSAVRKTGVLRAGVDLKVFDALADGPADAETVATACTADPRGTRILLNALAAIGLLEADQDLYTLAPGAERILVSTHPEYYGDAVRLAASDYEWDAIKHLGDAVRQGGTVMNTNAETPSYTFWEDFAELGTLNTQPVADLVADELLPWSDASDDRVKVLDVACGHGFYGYTLARKDPRAHIWSLDWPNVLAVTEANAQRLGVSHQAHFIPGDMFEAPLEGPYDIVIVANVLHHFSTERATQLLRRMADVVRPGGKLVAIAISTGDGRPADDPIPHLFSALMLAWTSEGQVHPLSAYEDMVTAAGFARPKLHTVPHNPLRVLLADRI
ncbi:class I SAM-dependent methyltransferase [Streptomyces minutiscleroticus]|uniref:O-methyltransferase n=3 Tax=Streptomyces TaxID=1883 RepID=A0A918U1J7_9ACTN|nr:class I SAM-dependent methyltransferase [Streptomyces minutiscleroticus]AXB74572.1 C-methyltransferase [Streptomyces roseiscleroticus]GGX79923.1 O-methyltransferase [Streptomyces minutiscleroticus]